jgi:hypothetical protein
MESPQERRGWWFKTARRGREGGRERALSAWSAQHASKQNKASKQERRDSAWAARCSCRTLAPFHPGPRRGHGRSRSRGGSSRRGGMGGGSARAQGGHGQQAAGPSAIGTPSAATAGSTPLSPRGPRPVAPPTARPPRPAGPARVARHGAPPAARLGHDVAPRDAAQATDQPAGGKALPALGGLQLVARHLAARQRLHAQRALGRLELRGAVHGQAERQDAHQAGGGQAARDLGGALHVAERAELRAGIVGAGEGGVVR